MLCTTLSLCDIIVCTTTYFSEPVRMVHLEEMNLVQHQERREPPKHLVAYSGGFANQAWRTFIRLVKETLDDTEEKDCESFQQLIQYQLSFVSSLKQPNPSASETVQIEASELDTPEDKYKGLQQENCEARQLSEEKSSV